MKQIIIFLTVSAFITIISIAWQNAPEKQPTPEKIAEMHKMEKRIEMFKLAFDSDNAAKKAVEYLEPSFMSTADSLMAILKAEYPNEEMYFQYRELNHSRKEQLKSKLARRKLESQN